LRPEIIHEGIAYRRYDNSYAISARGRVLRLSSLMLAMPYRRTDGYLEMRHHGLLHRMVATCWIRVPKKGELIHHKNHDKADNRAENLEWITPKVHMGEKHREAAGRYKRTEATRAKLRAYRLGRKHSEATKQKIREASLRLGCKPPPRPFGYKCTQSAIEKMRRNSPNGRPCRICGVVYASFGEAGRALGMKPLTLRRRCLSTSSFEDHEVLAE